MKLTRKKFMKTGILLTGGILLNTNNILQGKAGKNDNFIKLRNNIGIYTERGGTIGWYVDKDAFVVVDSQFPDTAKNFMDGIRKTTDRKIDVLYNTHHHADHTSGNAYLKDFTKTIVASEKCKTLQEKSSGSDSQKPTAFPTLTFDKEWTLDLGSEKIWAKHFGPAHTGGDSIFHFQKANIVHMGDLVFNRLFPYIDLESGGSIKKWMEQLSVIERTFDNDTIYIFGHSQKPEMCYGNVNDIRAMKNYLSSLLDYVSKEIKSGKTLEEISSIQEIPSVKDVKEMRDGMRKMNIEKAYQELTQIEK
jgi:cyclase